MRLRVPLSALVVFLVVGLCTLGVSGNSAAGVDGVPSKTESLNAEVKAERFQFQAEVSRLMDIIINSLYSNKDIFLRELISNGSDALDKLRFLALTDKKLVGEGEEQAKLDIEVTPNKEAGTLVIRDRGIGMNKDELIGNLGTVARSGTSKFLEAAKTGEDALSLIGQFGVGFYSAYLVADKVVVTSVKAGEDKQYIWESNAKDTFDVFEDPKGNTLGRGTEITLYLKEDAKEYLEEGRLTKIIEKYSEFINFPIYLYTTKTVKEEVPLEEDDVEIADSGDDEELDVIDETVEEDKPKTKTVEKVVGEWKKVNEHKPIWTRPKEEVTDEEYKEFFKLAYKEHTEPLTWTHFKAEGGVDFTALLYIPGTAPSGLYDNYYQKSSNVKLYVRRVLIADEFEDFLPRYLNFIKGVVDSDDLPINVSRETLQQNKILQIIGKRLVRNVLKMLEGLAEKEETKDTEDVEVADEDDDVIDDDESLTYTKFWNNFGRSIKLGVLEDQKNKNKLIKLLRFQSSKSGDEIASLDDYVERMKENQTSIYYISGESLESVKESPMLEELKKRDFEVLYFVDPLDEYLSQSLNEYDGYPLMSVTKEGLKFGDEDEEDLKQLEKDYKKLCEWFQLILGKRVEKVKISKRISVSPAVVVTSQWGWSANMERIMKAQPMTENNKNSYMTSRKTLEINPNNELIKLLKDKIIAAPNDKKLRDSAELIFDTALLSSGFAHEDPLSLVARVQRALSEEFSLSVTYPEFEEVQLSEEEEEEDEAEKEVSTEDASSHDEL